MAKFKAQVLNRRAISLRSEGGQASYRLTVAMHAFSLRNSGGKCQLKIFTKVVLSFHFLSLE